MQVDRIAKFLRTATVHNQPRIPDATKQLTELGIYFNDQKLCARRHLSEDSTGHTARARSQFYYCTGEAYCGQCHDTAFEKARARDKRCHLIRMFQKFPKKDDSVSFLLKGL